jgi:hypothetical protein
MSSIVTLEASARVIEARVGPIITLVSCSDGGYHGLNAKDVNGPSEIVDERGEAETRPGRGIGCVARGARHAR